MNEFEKLGVQPSIIKALNENNILVPTPIQEQAIPILLKFKTDFVGQAQTGTGKTAAYSIPLIQSIDVKNTKAQVLVITPTRELCAQIAKQIFKFTKHTDKIFIEKIIGGAPLNLQIENLKRPTHIIVATPGRLLELINKNIIDLDQIDTVVIDEADEIITMGFKQELDAILNVTNQKAFTWMFSATYPDDLNQMVKKYLSKDCKKIHIEGGTLLNTNILHQYYLCPKKEKENYILDFLHSHSKVKGIIFCRTQYKVEELHAYLTENGILAGLMHGELQQRDREKVMRMFRTSKVKVMVTTDISSRGLDIDDISYVIHENVPEKLEMYIHRSGRTARGNNKGITISFVSPEEIGMIKKLQSMLKIKFNKVN